MVLRIIFLTILTQSKEPRMVYARYVLIFGTILLRIPCVRLSDVDNITA